MKRNQICNLFKGLCVIVMVLLAAASSLSATVTAEIRMNPGTINLSSQGQWISACIELPKPYNVRDITANTVVLTVNGNQIIAQPRQVKIGDYNKNRKQDLMVKFDRQDLQSHLFLGPQVLTVSGSIAGGNRFEGTNTVRCIMDHKGLSRFTILQTSDIHNHASGYSSFYDYTPNGADDDDVLGGFARLASLIGTVRQDQSRAKIPTLLFDSGDFFMGTAYDLAPSNPIILKFFQAMKYDAVTLGNHEFDWGPGGLALLLGNGCSNGFTIPVIATNTVTDASNSGDDGIETLKSKGILVSKNVYRMTNGLKIGVLGLMGQNAHEEAPAASPVTFNHDYEFIQKCVNDLRKMDNVDIVVALSHGGVEKDGSGDDSDLAQFVSGIDIIASGHYHTATDDAFVEGDSNSIIFSPGEYGEFLSRLDITYSRALKRVVGFDFNLLPVNDSVPGVQAVQTMVEGYNNAINISLSQAGLPALDDIVSATNFDLELEPYQVTGLGSLCADAVRNVANALAPVNFPTSPIDISVVPSGTIRDPFLTGNEGYITFSDVYNCLPLGISPYSPTTPGYPLMHAYLSGQEVYLMCEIGLTLSKYLDADYYLNFSGIRISYDNGVQAVYLYPYDDIFCEGPLEPSDIINPSDTARLYHIAVDLYTLEMLNVVNSYLEVFFPGKGYSITPKKADGTPLSYADYSSHRIDATGSGVELKSWMALLNYLNTFNNNTFGYQIPEYLYGPDGYYEGRVMTP